MWLPMFLFSSPIITPVSSFKSIFNSVRLSQRFVFPLPPSSLQLFSDSFPKEDTNELPQQSNISSVTIDVLGVNNPPFSQSQAVTTLEDTPVSITLEGSDDDVEDQDDLIVYISELPRFGLLSQVSFFLFLLPPFSSILTFVTVGRFGRNPTVRDYPDGR